MAQLCMTGFPSKKCSFLLLMPVRSAMGIRSISLNSASELGFTAEIYSAVLNYYYKSIALVFPLSLLKGVGRLSKQ